MSNPHAPRSALMGGRSFRDITAPNNRLSPRVLGTLMWTSAVLGLAVLSAAAWMGLTLRYADGTSNSAAMYSLLDTGHVLETEIGRTVRPAMRRTEMLAKSPQLLAAMKSGAAAQTDLLNASIVTSTEVDAVALFDSAGKISALNTNYADGQPISPERIGRLLSADFTKSALNQSCLRNESDGLAVEFQTKCRIARALFDSSGLSVACSAPVIDPSTGGKVGVVSSRVRFDRLNRLVENRDFAGGAVRAYFVTDAGTYFTEDFNSGRAKPPVPVTEVRDVVRPLFEGASHTSVTKSSGNYLAVFSLQGIETFDNGGIHVLIVADEKWFTHGPRQERFVRAAVTGLVGALLLVVAGLTQAQRSARRTILERSVSEQRMRHVSLHDTLTGLANRALLTERITQCVRRSRETPGHLFAVIFLDLDRFKNVNDSLGHEAGDKLLTAIAQRLGHATHGLDSVFRVEPDHLARLGGDEFVVLLDPIRSSEEAIDVCQRIQHDLAEPYSINGQEVRSSASMGVAVSDARYENASDILRDADAALYAAKSSGRGVYRVYHSDMHASAVERLWMENELRCAIEREELSLVYQPIIDLETGRMSEVEALLRWRHPQRGLISPGDFIPIAEDTGLIVPLGTWVLRTACAQVKQWQAERAELAGLCVGVNVSCRQFSRQDMPETVRRILIESGLEPQCLKLEITETAVMENAAAAMADLRVMRSTGVQVRLDDFGTGYSSLGCLHRMPIEALKIDRSFVDAMTTDAAGASIVRAIIAVAHSLDMRVIAEGVETSAQLSVLRQLGCDYAQGYYFAKPLAANDLIAFSSRHHRTDVALAA